MNNLSILRKSRHILQKDIAQELGISRQVYSSYETGAAEPSIQTLCKMSKFFNVSIDVIVGNCEIPQSCDENNKYYTELEDLIKKLKYSDQLQVLGFVKGILSKRS